MVFVICFLRCCLSILVRLFKERDFARKWANLRVDFSICRISGFAGILGIAFLHEASKKDIIMFRAVDKEDFMIFGVF